MYCELINRASRARPFLSQLTDVKYIPHFHPETEIVYVIDGELTFTLGTNSHTIVAGDICIISPDAIHSLVTEQESTTYMMKLYPAIDLANIQFDEPIITSQTHGYEQLKACILQVMEENSTREPGYELAVNIQAERILLLLLREFRHHTLEGKKISRHINESAFLSRINDYLNSHYTEDFGLDDISTQLNYEKSYFCRYFKRVTGMTFWEYYTLFRLDHSVQLMKQSPKDTISMVANASGFNNIRSYNEAFKKNYHCTPLEYKKKLLQI